MVKIEELLRNGDILTLSRDGNELSRHVLQWQESAYRNAIDERGRSNDLYLTFESAYTKYCEYYLSILGTAVQAWNMGTDESRAHAQTIVEQNRDHLKAIFKQVNLIPPPMTDIVRSALETPLLSRVLKASSQSELLRTLFGIIPPSAPAGASTGGSSSSSSSRLRAPPSPQTGGSSSDEYPSSYVASVRKHRAFVASPKLNDYAPSPFAASSSPQFGLLPDM